MLREILFWLSIVSLLSPLPSFIYGLFLRKRMNLYCIPVLVLSGVGFIVEILALLAAFYWDENKEIFHFYTVIEFILWCMFYNFFFKNKTTSIVIYISILVFTILAIFEFMFIESNGPGSYVLSIEALSLIALSFYLFLFVMRNQVTENLLQESFFWINCGILIYFSGNAVLFLFEKFLNNEQTWRLWGPIHNGLNILLNVLIFVGFLKERKVWK